jgi:hypothetical protein
MVPSASMGREKGGALFFFFHFFFFFFFFFSPTVFLPLTPFGALGVLVISPFGPLDCLCLLILTCK